MMKKKRLLSIMLLTVLLVAVFGLTACRENDEEGGKATKNVVSIDLVETSIRSEYIVGEKLDVTGAKLWVFYSDNTEEFVSVTPEMVSEFETSTTGEKSALVTYASQKTKYYYRVSAQRPEPDYFETLENEDGTLIIESVKENCPETIYLPATLGGKTVKTISSNAFSKAKASRVVIEEGVETLYKSAFANNEYIDFVTLPDSITTIGDFAFWDCSSLEEITFGSGITVFGNGVMRDCPTLVRVTLPSALETVGTYTFYNCTALDTIDLPATVTNVEAGAFWNCSTLKGVSLPNVTEIKDNTFKNCYALRDIDIADVTAIGKSAFENVKFSKFTFPANLTEIGDKAFLNVPLTSIVLPEGLISIGNNAFENLETRGSLKELILPASLQTMGESAFFGENNLETVTIKEPSALTGIPSRAFGGCSTLREFKIPAKVTTIGDSAFSDAGYMLADEEGASFVIDFTEAENLETIESSAFAGAYIFGTLTIPDSVKSIGYSAFENTRISELVFTANSALTEMRDLASGYSFVANCRNLTRIVFPPVSSFTSGWLEGISALKEIDLSNTKITLLDSRMFYNCSTVTAVRLPKTLTQINDDAFSGANVSQIFYSGTQAEWNALRKIKGWDNELQPGYTVTCTAISEAK